MILESTSFELTPGIWVVVGVLVCLGILAATFSPRKAWQRQLALIGAWVLIPTMTLSILLVSLATTWLLWTSTATPLTDGRPHSFVAASPDFEVRGDAVSVQVLTDDGVVTINVPLSEVQHGDDARLVAEPSQEHFNLLGLVALTGPGESYELTLPDTAFDNLFVSE